MLSAQLELLTKAHKNNKTGEEINYHKRIHIINTSLLSIRMLQLLRRSSNASLCHQEYVISEKCTENSPHILKDKTNIQGNT